MTTNVWPNLGYRDAQAAIDFLVTAFGFEKVAVYEGPEGDVRHAELRWPGGGGVTLHNAGSNSIADLTERAAGDGGYPAYSIHVDTQEPDALFERAVAAGAAVVREVQDSPHGARGFVVHDPEGLYWSFGTPLPELVRGANGEWRPVAEAQRPST
jgi:uncharacterized glyoxalase superfamily protein PhnB